MHASLCIYVNRFMYMNINIQLMCIYQAIYLYYYYMRISMYIYFLKSTLKTWRRWQRTRQKQNAPNCGCWQQIRNAHIHASTHTNIVEQSIYFLNIHTYVIYINTRTYVYVVSSYEIFFAYLAGQITTVVAKQFLNVY